MMSWLRRRNPGRFFSPEERDRIVAAIRRAEQETSGEIRVHLARRAGDDPLATARATFAKLGMAATRRRNGVLILIALADREFAIYGDEGVDRAVGAAGWQEIRDDLAEHFRRGAFCDGVCRAVARVGETLQTAFPAEAGDTNELSDLISTDDDSNRSGDPDPK
jgi:uncharacterized membrane protein